jgi:hypothetical protein
MIVTLLRHVGQRCEARPHHARVIGSVANADAHPGQERLHRGRTSEHASLGSGLLIGAMADSSNVSLRPSGGTRVVMQFAMRSAA